MICLFIVCSYISELGLLKSEKKGYYLSFTKYKQAYEKLKNNVGKRIDFVRKARGTVEVAKRGTAPERKRDLWI